MPENLAAATPTTVNGWPLSVTVWPERAARAKSIAPEPLGHDDRRGSTRHVIGVAQRASSSEWNSKRHKEIARHHLALDGCRTVGPSHRRPDLAVGHQTIDQGRTAAELLIVGIREVVHESRFALQQEKDEAPGILERERPDERRIGQR